VPDTRSTHFEATLKLTGEGPARAGRLRTEVENVCRLVSPLI
jgi:hypothetical protein